MGDVVVATIISLWEKDGGEFLFIIFFNTGNTFFPVLFGVLVYQLIRWKWPIGHSSIKFVVHIILLIVVYIILVSSWTYLELVETTAYHNVNWFTLTRQYNASFSNYWIVGLTVAISIPAIDYILTKKAIEAEQEEEWP